MEDTVYDMREIFIQKYLLILRYVYCLFNNRIYIDLHQKSTFTSAHRSALHLSTPIMQIINDFE